MKNQIQSPYCSLFRHFPGLRRHMYMVFGLILSLVGLPSAVFADATWVGGTSQDWNTGANWSANPPTGSFTINTATAGVYPIISANSAFAPVDILVGVGVAGSVDQNAGTNSTGAGNWLIMGQNNGGAGTYNLNGGTLNAGAIHMNHNGSGSSTSTLNVSGTVNSGAETVVNDGQNSGISGTGTLNVNSGGILNSESDLLVSFAGGGLGQVNIAAGATVNVATTTKRWVIVNEWDTTRGSLTNNGGTLNLNANTDIQFSTGSYQPGASQGPSSVTLNSGAITSWSGNQTGVGSGVVNLNNDGTSTGISNTFNLNGGTLTISAIVSGQSAGTRVFNFNGGTLKPTASSTTFFASGGASVANVRDNGAIIDSNGKDITISQTLEHSTISGDAATDGGLTKAGNGTLTISGALSYTGPTKVLGGVLTLNSSLGLPSGGDLVVSNATLTLDATSDTPMSANNVTVGSTLNLALSPSANAINAAGSLTLGNNTTINLTYGTLSSNPTVAALNGAGNLTKGTNVVINISAVGLGQGLIPLITVGSGTVNTNGFVLGTLPSGVKGVLTNSTSTSLDLLVTSAGQLLSWHGANSDNSVVLTNWNINTSSNWYDIGNNPIKYLQYSGNTVGDNVIFGDNGYNTDGTNHVNLSVTVVPATVAFSSSSPYTLMGAGGIGGATSLVLTNMNNSVFLGTINSYTGGTIVGSGTLIITNDNALGATAGGVALAGGTLQLNGAVSSTRAIAVTANSGIGVTAGANAQLGGVISGTGSLTKSDNGTLTLSALNTCTGPLLLSAGTINLTGTATPGATTVGAASGDAVLNISGNLTGNNLFVGNVSGAVGAVFQTAGTVTLSGGTGDTLNVGNWDASFGYYNAIGGTMNLNGISIGGENNPNVWPPQGSGDGIMEVIGATINNIGWIVLARGGNAQTGILNVYSGSLTYSGGGIGCNWQLSGSGQTSIINIMGGSVTSTDQGVNFRTVNTGILNLNGGVLSGTSVTGTGTVNFNGGTLRPALNSSSPFLNVDDVYVYSGGGTIDDNGQTITLSQAFLAPTGNGVYGIASFTGGAGYIAPPIVTISGDGIGATAIAQIDRVAGTVTNIIITCPGVNYTYSTFNVSGGGATTVATITGTTPVANTSGGLTKNGAGTLTLSGANTYPGTTMVNSGTLLLTPNQPTATPVVVANGATLGINTSSATNGATIGNLTLGSTGAASLGFTYGIVGNPTIAALTAGAVTVNGGSSIKIGGVFAVGTFPLLKYSSLSSVPTLVAPRGTTATLSNDTVNTTLYVRVTATGGGIVWTGNTGLIPNLWDINVTTNWLTGVTATTYQQPVAPGDSVTFNDSGSGTVLVSNTVSPASVTVNNSVAYAFRGTGQINSTLGLTKLGSGTVTLSLPGSYSGSTVVSNGTISLGASQTFANLSGNGTVATAAGAPMLTANNSTNSTFSGSLQGSLSVTKTGSGTLTLSGTGSSTSGSLIVNGGSVNVSGGSTAFGTGVSRVGYLANSGDLTMTGGSLTTGGELQVGGSDQNGTANNATGTVTVANATLSVGALTVARGNNNQNTVSGTVTLNGGGTLNSEGDTLLGFAGNNNLGKIVLNGGTLNVATTTKRWLIMSEWDTALSQIDVNSGQVNINAGTDIRFATQGNTGTNVINLNGGAITFYSDNHTTIGGTGVVDLHQGNGSTVDNTFNLNGGTLAVSGVLSANTSGNQTFNFNGGTLKAVANNASFVNLGGSAVANVRNAGAIIDSAGFNVTIPQVLQHSAISGDNATDGGLTKIGNGTLTLSGANTYTGTTTISNGVLAVTGSLSTGAVHVKSGAILAGNGVINGPVTDNGDGVYPADFLGASYAGTTLTINNTLTMNGTVTMCISKTGGTLTNDVITGITTANYGGTLVITNVTSDANSLTTSDSFQLFNAGAHTGNFASVQSSNPGLVFSFANGVLTVVSVSAIPSNPTNITYSVSGSTLTLSWPTSYLGWLAQSNAVGIAASNSWYNIPGSGSATTLNVNLDKTKHNVFYRLQHP